MAVKPENTFRRSVHKHLPHDLYHTKTNNPFEGGIADDWYSSTKADLWVEYKYIAKVTPTLCRLPDLSPLQRNWVNARLTEGRNVAVIVGCPTGGVLYQNKEWECPLTPIEFNQRLRSRVELANWILAFTRGGP